MLKVDLNCDMGESFGAWKMGNDGAIMKYVSSVNVACGFHAGDPTTIRNTVCLALDEGVAIGAHPSYPDLQGFGRRNMSLTSKEIHDIVLYQVAALKGVCEASGGQLHHVKPHGALYNQAAKDIEMAHAIAEAVRSIDRELILYGLAGSHLISEAEKFGLRAANEVFADRTYRADGTLTPRTEKNALISDSRTAAAQALQMVKDNTVTATNGAAVSVNAETICIHGDGENALEFSRSLHQELSEQKIEITAI